MNSKLKLLIEEFKQATESAEFAALVLRQSLPLNLTSSHSKQLKDIKCSKS